MREPPAAAARAGPDRQEDRPRQGPQSSDPRSP